MENCFDSKKYLELLKETIKQKANKTKGKLYIEVNWKLLEDDFAQRIFPWYDTDNKKKLIIELKHEAEIFVCVNAHNIIENPTITKKNIPYVQHIEHTLKRIETATTIRPHLIITNINPEEMYDIIFNFETRYQKKGFKVRENYNKKGFPYNKAMLLSENGFWNDDHIPVMKKIVFVTWIWTNSWKLSTAIGQIYQDHEIDIQSSFAMLQTLPLSELDTQNPINQARAKKMEADNLIQDEEWETSNESAEWSFKIVKDLLWNIVENDNLISEYKKASDMIICPTFECITHQATAEKIAENELK